MPSPGVPSLRSTGSWRWPLDGGCILEEQLGNLTFADRTEYPKTLRKVQQPGLDIKTIIAGHWSAVHGPELIEQYLALLKHDLPLMTSHAAPAACRPSPWNGDAAQSPQPSAERYPKCAV